MAKDDGERQSLLEHLGINKCILIWLTVCSFLLIVLIILVFYQMCKINTLLFDKQESQQQEVSQLNNFTLQLASNFQHFINTSTFGRLLNVTVLKSGVKATYTKNPYANSLLVECLGGGGGGGGCYISISGYDSVGGGGGAGGYCRKWISNPSLTYTYTIGTGGSGGYATNNGNSGNPTTFGSLLKANGGLGGYGCSNLPVSGTPGAMIPGGNGGSASGGDVNVIGQVGNRALIINGGYFTPGFGGSSVYGGSGGWSYQYGNGIDATINSGSGGGGANCGSLSPLTGGSGASGLIIVWEYT